MNFQTAWSISVGVGLICYWGFRIPIFICVVIGGGLLIGLMQIKQNSQKAYPAHKALLEESQSLPTYSVKNNAQSKQEVKCPYCAEIIKSEAIKCKHCGEWLSKKQEEKYTHQRENVDISDYITTDIACENSDKFKLNDSKPNQKKYDNKLNSFETGEQIDIQDNDEFYNIECDAETPNTLWDEHEDGKVECANCGMRRDYDSEECLNCGVVFTKLEALLTKNADNAMKDNNFEDAILIWKKYLRCFPENKEKTIIRIKELELSKDAFLKANENEDDIENNSFDKKEMLFNVFMILIIFLMSYILFN